MEIDAAHNFVAKFAVKIDIGAVDTVIDFYAIIGVGAVFEFFAVEATEAVFGVIEVISGAVFVLELMDVEAGGGCFEFFEFFKEIDRGGVWGFF